MKGEYGLRKEADLRSRSVLLLGEILTAAATAGEGWPGVHKRLAHFRDENADNSMAEVGIAAELIVWMIDHPPPSNVPPVALPTN